MGLVVWPQLEGRQFDTFVAKLQVPGGIARLTVTSMTPKGRGMMGLVVSQQLEGHQFEILVSR
ncbi:unnamed protein product, partial [Staurois parvus]